MMIVLDFHCFFTHALSDRRSAATERSTFHAIAAATVVAVVDALMNQLRCRKGKVG
jgi:hypothetical protein